MATPQAMSKIENHVVIRAPRSRVWRALTTPSEFSAWFYAKLSVPEFNPGVKVDLVSTYPGHEGTRFGFEVVEKRPESRFVWRWKPTDESEPYTTVVFELQEVKDGTLVKVTESGFDRISLARRAKAFAGNREGWQIQMRNLREYVESH